jgi:uncharacterized SAM-binding protein YcdF (DUF218 family)
MFLANPDMLLDASPRWWQGSSYASCALGSAAVAAEITFQRSHWWEVITLVDALKHSLELAFSPLGIMTLLMAGGVVLARVRRKSRWGRRLLVAGALLFLLFTFAPLAEFLIRGLERNYAPLLSPPTSAPIRHIVVLSAYGEDHPAFPVTSNVSDQTLCRLVEGIRLHRQIPGAKMVLSGGVLRKGDKPVAAIMADFTRSMGIPEHEILVEDRSRTTYENLVEVGRIVGTEPFILVTSAADLRRAMAVAGRLGMRPVAAPACIWALQHYPADMPWGALILAGLEGFAYPSPTRWRYLQWAYHEHLGYFFYMILGRL